MQTKGQPDLSAQNHRCATETVDLWGWEFMSKGSLDGLKSPTWPRLEQWRDRLGWTSTTGEGLAHGIPQCMDARTRHSAV